MSIKSRAALLAQRLTTIFANTSNQIDGGDHATLVDDLIDSCVNKTTDTTLLGLFGYDTGRTYAVGQGVIYDSELYECNTITTGTWNYAHWDLVAGGGASIGVFDTATTDETINGKLPVTIGGTTKYLLFSNSAS